MRMVEVSPGDFNLLRCDYSNTRSSAIDYIELECRQTRGFEPAGFDGAVIQ